MAHDDEILRLLRKIIEMLKDIQNSLDRPRN